ncbi:hypothetical protein LLH23_02335 [bacterium]|nr:hypothetical protein [bacterium]
MRRFTQERQYLGLGDEVYPRILDTLSRIFHGKYEEAALCWGIGSGKSFLCSLALLYMVYRTLCLRDPQQYYGLAEGSPIHIVTVGPTARVAEKAIYGQIRGMVSRSPWFADKYPADTRTRRELHFPKHVEVLPGNSSDLFPLGLNVLCATMDEAAFFVETQSGGQEAAEEVYLALQRRIKSRFGSRGLVLIASSPRHGEDFIMQKLAEAETNPTVFASRKATWEVKPGFSGETCVEGGLEVPVELAGEFRRNPQKARRDLAAQPGAAYQPFFVDMGALEAACGGARDGDGNGVPPPAPSARGRGNVNENVNVNGDGVLTPTPLPRPPSPSGLRQAPERGTADDNGGLPRQRCALTPLPGREGKGNGVEVRHPFAEEGRLADWFRPDDAVPRYVHIDLGLKKDACGMAMAKVVSEGGQPVAVVELMLQLTAPAGGEVNLATPREIVLALRRRGFPIGQVSYDGWQSADSLQILRRHGVRAVTVSVDRDLGAYETLKELANDGRLRMYPFKPFLEECRRLELIQGTKVDHPAHGSKDVADAVAGAVSEAVKAWGGTDVRGRIV